MRTRARPSKQLCASSSKSRRWQVDDIQAKVEAGLEELEAAEWSLLDRAFPDRAKATDRRKLRDTAERDP